jgi:CRP-like cAMP-binding protein
MTSSSDATGNLGWVGARFAQAGTWVACCLSRGRRAPLGENDIDQLVAEFGESRFAGGTVIFSQGDEAARIHVVRTGSVELSRVINGRRVVLQILQAGDVFGDVPAFLGEPEPVDAHALEDCVILSLDASTLFVLLQTRPRVARRWFVSLAERMAGLQNRLGDLLAGSLEAQLASILLRDGVEGRPVTLTQAQLALMLGAARTSVQRVLKQLEQDGFIDVGYRRIDVIDPDGLAALIGSSES